MAQKSDKPLVWLRGEIQTPPFGVFAKKTDATPTGVLDTCRKRLADYLKVVSAKERR